MNRHISALIAESTTVENRDRLERGLSLIPRHLLVKIAQGGGRIVALSEGQTYVSASPVLRTVAPTVDEWPVPPAGLFVRDENTVYLRSLSDMAIVHEAMHALDYALGNGVYFSSIDESIRRNFRNAYSFVTPYAASGLDEYFAEAGRAMVGANAPNGPWPKVSAQKLQSLDPDMFKSMSAIFTEVSA